MINTPLKLAFIVRSLDFGGAQRQVISLAKALDPSQFEITVLTFYPGPLERELAGSGVRVISLNKRSRWDIGGFLWRLIRQVRLIRPDVVHGYLDIPNLLALGLRLFVRTRVVWGLRTSTIELKHYDWLHRIAAKLERRFSRWADLIIINSVAGLEQHAARGFPRDRMLVIPNGFDTMMFKPEPEAGERLRAQWGVPPLARLIGIVGRLDPMKDHENFIRAAAFVSSAELSTAAASQQLGALYFVCIGTGPADYRDQLQALANELGLAERLFWRNATTEVVAVYNTLDVLVSASSAEGLPNAVGEAMSCGVPCVVTDVGDCRRLVGDCGVVVPPQNPAALADGITRCLTDNPAELGSRARARITTDFGTEKLAQATAAAILSLAGLRRQ